MPAPTASDLGPLAPLVGTWEGSEGLDVSYQHATGAIVETPFRERTVFNPFGPVDNGTQSLFGLDYRMAAWRNDEPDPFHTEVGYWLWDAEELQVMRCFMVPRGSTLLAGGTTTADARLFVMRADVGDETYGILSNKYLARQARTVSYEVAISIGDDGSYSYDETTTYDSARYGQRVEHTDKNRLVRVA